MSESEKQIPYTPLEVEKVAQSKTAHQFYKLMNKRRSIRHFSDEWVDEQIINDIIKTAGTAPSGAHKQPWQFCAISNKALKHKIRLLAEAEERQNYTSRMGEDWKKDLEPFGTNAIKEFIDVAPWLIVVFRKPYDINSDGKKTKNYYVMESVGIAAGMLISAIHNAGLVTLTHTPSPMDFLSQILQRPSNEKAFLLLPVGYPAKNAQIPDLQRKPIDEIAKYYR
ncbi:MAG: nitroreductase family protein [Putridiphycobacter sp.]|nr:nitroreductase family protein [Putridiphycobacter sp.]